jgi:hypothetical protein
LLGSHDFDLLRRNGELKDEVCFANQKLSDINCSIDIANDEFRVPFMEYKEVCSVLNVLNSKLAVLLDSHSRASNNLERTTDSDCRDIISQILSHLSSEISSLVESISKQEIMVSDRLSVAILAKRKLSIANSVHRTLLRSYSPLFISSIEISGRVVRNLQRKIKLRFKVMSSTKGSSSNKAGDGPVICGACNNEHLTKDCPFYSRGRDSDHSDCQRHVPELNPVLGASKNSIHIIFFFLNIYNQ